MTNGPHTLGVGYGSLLVWRALRVWIRSRLNSSGKCRITNLPRLGSPLRQGHVRSRELEHVGFAGYMLVAD